MKPRMLPVAAVMTVALGTSGIAHAQLIVRASGSIWDLATDTELVSGLNLIYDTDLDITWLDYTYDGGEHDPWNNLVSWADDLSVKVGDTFYSDWRLPATVDGEFVWGYEGDPDDDGIYSYTAGYNLANSELGHLYYTELGNLGLVASDGTEPQPGWGLGETGPFENLAATFYWSGTENVGNPGGSHAWAFDFSDGRQLPVAQDSESGDALAVMNGDIFRVTEPSTLLLLGLALGGLSLVGRRTAS